jgi:hypothetical protein
MQIKLLTAAIISSALASPPSESYCKQARTAYTVAGAQCGISAAFSPAFATACGVGVGIYTISIEIACGIAGHFVGEELPPIATKMLNGTIVDLPGNEIHNLVDGEETVSLRKRGISLCGAGLDCMTVDHKLYENIGFAAGSKESCSELGRQVCVPGNRAFMTCASGNRWTIQQACGAGTRCQTHPSAGNRILCGW